MAKSCSAYGCSNRFVEESTISFHHFPLKDSKLCTEWLISIKRDRFIPKEHSYICSEHFLSTDFLTNAEQSNKSRLKPQAVSSVFQFPDNFIKSKKTRKEPTKRTYHDACEETASSDLQPSSKNTHAI